MEVPPESQSTFIRLCTSQADTKEDTKPEGASSSDLPPLPSSMEVPPESLKTEPPPVEAAEAEEGAGDAAQQNW